MKDKTEKPDIMDTVSTMYMNFVNGARADPQDESPQNKTGDKKPKNKRKAKRRIKE
jgi:hypothetical protein